MRFGQTLDLPRCPHCSIAHPSLTVIGKPDATYRADGGTQEIWAIYKCSSCGSLILAKGKKPAPNAGIAHIDALYPPAQTPAEDLPPTARRFLQQAMETLHAPDAAAVMAGSAVDAMLKHLNFIEGSVYHRIEQAVAANVLTKGMGEWAHSVRLGSNRPRHADAERPHVTPEEAAQAVEFATALGQFLFVLTARVQRGIEKAKAAGPA